MTHSVRAHWLAGCAPHDGNGGESARIALQALGDFEPSPKTFDTLKGSARNAPLLSPPGTRAVVLDAKDEFSHWTGLGLRDPSGDFDVTLWPTGAACAIRSPPDLEYPGVGTGQAVGVADDGRTLLVAGGEGRGQSASALAVDLGTGVSAAVSGSDGPRTHRAGGTATAFGANLLVAGGYEPETGDPLGSAEVFDVATRRFEAERVALERPRAHHAAVTMASGDTLLVGGVDTGGRLIRTLEAISPDTREYRIANLTELEVPRRDPVALRLSDGTLLVAGGTDGGSPASPVESLEWLAADGSRTVRRTLGLSDATEPTTVRQAFAAMPGGGVLVAGGCDLREPADADEASACESACGPSSGCPSRKVQWITSDGAITTLPGALDAGAPNPVLVAGSEGRPWLVCDAGEGRAGVPADGAGASSPVRRFDPFSGKFIEPPDVPSPATAATHFVAADAGLFTWLEPGPAPGADAGSAASRSVLAGFRHGTRSAFAPDVLPLGSTDRVGVALDRPPSGAFDPGTGHVILPDADAALVLTDTTYTDVHLAIGIVAGAPPVVRLGDRAYGTADCPWPASGTTAPYTVKVDRTGGEVVLSMGAGARSCDGPAGRISVRIEGGGARSVVISSVTVSRVDAS